MFRIEFWVHLQMHEMFQLACRGHSFETLEVFALNRYASDFSI